MKKKERQLFDELPLAHFPRRGLDYDRGEDIVSELAFFLDQAKMRGVTEESCPDAFRAFNNLRILLT